MPVRIGKRYQVQSLPAVRKEVVDDGEHADPVCLYSPVSSSSSSTDRHGLWGSWWDVLLLSWVLAALRAVFGYDSFRGAQAEAIDAVLEEKDGTPTDVLVVMATGHGKSLCYQIPALVRGRAAVVVSPLVSLMQDQVEALQAKGLTACFLGSAQTDASVWRRLDTFQFLYVTPECASSERFGAALDDVHPCLVAIDEAHCVSEWGFDFRPEYRTLRDLRDKLPGVPFVAVTATATQRTREDIVHNLGFSPATSRTFVTTVDRPNLTYTHETRKDYHTLLRELRAMTGAAILYVPTVKGVEELAQTLARDLAPKAVGVYHGQLDKEERARVHRGFVKDELPIVVATLAFGMGIDKPDVRLVVHWGPPKTVESYYQQAGRAGRDGDAARCVLFTSPSDWPSLQRLLTYNVADEATATRALAGLRGMRGFCDTTVCRRIALVQYFGSETTSTSSSCPSPCGACDVCLADHEDTTTVDVTRVAKAVLRVVQALEGRYGRTTVLDVCRGAGKPRLAHLACYGAAQGARVEDLQHALDGCRANGLLVDTTVTLPTMTYAALQLTEAGEGVLQDESATVRVKEKKGSSSSSSGKRRKTTTADSSASSSVLETLKRVRREVADGVPPYMVCSDATLRDMAHKAPKTRTALLTVHGIGAHKADKYGAAFLAVFGG